MVMPGEVLAMIASFACALTVLAIGAATAWDSANAIKRAASVLLIEVGAFGALAALDAPEPILVAAFVFGIAYVLVGAAILVRLQEVFASVEAADTDAGAAASEPAERET